METDLEYSNRHDECDDSYSYRWEWGNEWEIHIVLNFPDHDKYRDKKEGSNNHVDNRYILHSFHSLEQPDRKEDFSEDCEEWEEEYSEMLIEYIEVEYEDQSEKCCDDTETYLDSDDIPEYLRYLVLILPIDRYISRGCEIEPIVHKYEKVRDKCSCKRHNPILLWSYHSCDIGKGDEWEDIAEYLECSEGEDIANYSLVVLDGVFDTVEHGWDLDFGGLYPEVPKSKKKYRELF
jgi:hypothetical protein